MVGIVSVSAGSSVHHWLFGQWGGLAHDFAIDTLFGDGEWLFLKLVLVVGRFGSSRDMLKLG